MANITNIVGGPSSTHVVNSICGNVDGNNIQIASVNGLNYVSKRGDVARHIRVNGDGIWINGKKATTDQSGETDKSDYLHINGVRYLLPNNKEERVLFLNKKAYEVARDML